jgi:hypothetical protein
LGVTREKIMQIVEAPVGKMETQLQHWGARLDGLIALVEAAGPTLKTDCQKSIDNARPKYQAAQARFAEFKRTGSARWGAFKSVVARAMATLGDML